ncbi:hypothetical protein I8748_32350 [Nostoc sp. CENA67]|uniref:Uncharacterized protein n=1 Tax=Amazonocrinis nigriterrae CENA67 TaxID=2794033 RepID=A0A8J7HVS5_9NOST|nr:hypothetical protein [Amazonocrinis nigriterrae]MBH8566787.1 hypothetical protein [Amazonocrinis nigriterrae CENA67]
MLSTPVHQIKNALAQALANLPDFNNMNPFQKGKVIDVAFKSILKDLMDQFGMKPGIDYVDDLGDTEPATDFVALSKRADELITGLMEGKIIAVSGYLAKSKTGREYEVKAYYKRKSVA